MKNPLSNPYEKAFWIVITALFGLSIAYLDSISTRLRGIELDQAVIQNDIKAIKKVLEDPKNRMVYFNE